MSAGPANLLAGARPQEPTFFHPQPGEPGAVAPASFPGLQALAIEVSEDITHALLESIDYIIGGSFPSSLFEHLEDGNPVILYRQYGSGSCTAGPFLENEKKLDLGSSGSYGCMTTKSPTASGALYPRIAGERRTA